MWHEATARLQGGFLVRVRAAMASTNRGRLGQTRLVLSVIFEVIAHAIAWPLPWLSRRIGRRFRVSAQSSLMPKKQPPRLMLAVLYSFLGLNAKALSVLSICILMYLLAAFTRLDALGLQLFHGLFVVFGNAVMLSQALLPGGMSLALRRQPFNPTIQLSVLLFALGTILILSFTAILRPDSLRDATALQEIALHIFKVPDPVEIWKRNDWSPTTVWALLSAFLLSTVVIQSFTTRANLKRADPDHLALAMQLAGAGFFADARRHLQQVSAANADYLVTSGVVSTLEGESERALLDLRDGIRLFARDWPRPATEDELETLILSTQIVSSLIPMESIHQSLVDWTAKPRRPIDAMRISEALYICGRMGTQAIRNAFQSTSPLLFALANAALEFIDKRPNEAARALLVLPNPPVPGWRPADGAIHIAWLLLVTQPWKRDNPATLAASHTWCASHRAQLEELVRSALLEQDVLGVVSCFQILNVCRDALAAVSPVDSQMLAEVAKECDAFLSSFASGRTFAAAATAAYAVLQGGMHDHGEA